MAADDEEDIALIERFQKGDEAALEELIGLHREGLFRFIYHHLLDEHEAADVLSQTFFKAYYQRQRYRVRPNARFQTWLYTIAANLSRDHLRKRKRRPGDFSANLGDADAVDRETDPASNPSEQAAQSEDLGLLRQAIATLPPPMRDALILCVIEGRSRKETAELLGCTVRAVEARVRRAKRLLEVEMDQS